MSNHVDQNGQKFVVLSEAYEHYRKWCERNGIKDPKPSHKFYKQLSQIVPDWNSKIAVRKVGGRNVKVLLGHGMWSLETS